MSATVFYNAAAELATCANTFRVGTTPTDPTVVTLVITNPAGVTVTYNWPGTPNTLTHGTSGVFSQDVPCSAAVEGIWSGVWTGTGAASDVVAFTWTVGTTNLNQFYCSVEELKSRLKIDGTGDDFELTVAVQAASRSIDEICGRYFWRGTDTRTYVPESYWRQSVDDLVSVTSLKVDRDGDGVYEETWAQGTDYALEVAPGKYNPGSTGEQRPYTGFTVTSSGKLLPFVYMWRHLDAVQVTGVFGWPAVPLIIKMSSLILAEDLFKLKDAAFGVAGLSDLGVIRVSANPMAYSGLGRYKSGQRVGV